MDAAVSRAHWLLLGTATLLLLACTLAARLSSSPSVFPLTLSPGSSGSCIAFRLLPDSVRISLRFRGFQRPELGNYISRHGDGFVLFDSPGEPIVLEVRGPRGVAMYEALPASSYSAPYIRRSLVVRDFDDDPHRFQWPPNNASRTILPIGTSTVTLTVLSVGAPLSGEEVSAILEAPLSIKSASPGYGFLWWFFFWPVFAVPLGAYAAYLVWRELRSRSRASSAA